jgi:splicing factor 3A subunit 3
VPHPLFFHKNQTNKNMSSYLDQTRLLHIELEQSIKSIVYEFQNKAKTHKATIYQNHRINEHLNNVKKCSLQLLELYDEEVTLPDGLNRETLNEEEESYRDRELKSITGDTLSESISSFDAQLNKLLEYHARYPAAQIIEKTAPTDQDLAEISRKLQTEVIEPKVQFTGEERYGKFVDLNDLYQIYINLPLFIAKDKNEARIDYLTYLSTLSHFHKIDRNLKNDDYLHYLELLRDYLTSFYQKTQPLCQLDDMLKKAEQEFEEHWNKGTVSGYEELLCANEVPKQEQNNAQKGQSNSQKEQNKSTENEEKKKKKKRNRKKHHGKKKDVSYFKKIAKLEHICSFFIQLLTDVIEATMIQLEKKQVRTWEEIQNDLAREEKMEEEMYRQLEEKEKEGEEEDTGISNPRNLPLGWDGKPIPLWLYKLHGLNQEYKCEICGNYSYWGPMAFEKHFQEWRHANGMRCLRIPNTRHFHQITKIADAIALWEKIKKEEGEHIWKADDMEEYEDKEGNVFNKKTYMDLKRQGLLD